MVELFTESVKLVNLPYTALLALVLLYWLMYLLGAVGSEILDFDAGVDVDMDADVDVDLDVDMDVDADADVDMDAHAGSGAGWVVSVLSFFHAGQVPVVLIFSVLALCMWTYSVLANYFLVNSNALIGLLLAVPIIGGGLMTTKAVIMPFAPLLKRAFKQSSDKIDVIGKTCTIISGEATHEYGQAELKTRGAPLLLNVKTKPGVTLSKGEEAIVYEQEGAAGDFLVTKLDTSAYSDQEELP